MNQYYQDNMLFGMNPSSYLHRYAVNGKVSGNLACISEIKNAAVVLYSPRGCGFHYRCHVRSGQSPVYELECADLRNNDVIFGPAPGRKDPMELYSSLVLGLGIACTG